MSCSLCPMLLGIHVDDTNSEELRSRLISRHDWKRFRRVLDSYRTRENAFTAARPGLPKPAPLTAPQMTPLAHGASAFSLLQAIEPTPEVEALLRDFPLWALEPDLMLLHGSFLQGQFLRCVILSLDAVGHTLTTEQRNAVLEHLILTTIDNPDPSAPVNKLPDG